MDKYDKFSKTRQNKRFPTDRNSLCAAKGTATAFKRHIVDCEIHKNISKYQRKRSFLWQDIQKQPLGFSRNYNFKTVILEKDDSPLEIKKKLSSICYVPITGNSGMELLGKGPFKIGKRPTTTFGPSPGDVNFFKSEELSESLRIEDLEETVCLKGGFDGTLPHFRAFSREGNWYYKSLNRTKELVTKVTKRFESHYELNIPTRASIWFTPIKPTANAGGESGFFFKIKEKAWASCCKTACLLNELVTSMEVPCWSIYTLGDRPKRNKNIKIGNFLEARLVMMQDFVEYLLARPWTLNLEKTLFNMFETPIKIGVTNAGEGYHVITSKDKIYPYVVELDWSLFDSSQRADIIIGAFGLARGMFPKSEFVDNIFIYFCDGLLYKYVLQGDGNLFKIKQGLPSGSIWTTIINSFANCILMEFIGNKYSAFKNTKFDYDVAGDDGKLFFEEKVQFDKDNLINYTKEKLNMDLKIEMEGNPISTDPDLSVCFLKLCLYWDEKLNIAVPTTPPKAIKTRLSCPQKDFKTKEAKLNFIMTQSESLINHPKCTELVSKYFKNKRFQFLEKDALISTLSGSDLGPQIHQFNEEVYFTARPYKYYGELKAVMGERVVPSLSDEYSWEPDFKFVYNWITDNTIIDMSKYMKIGWRHFYFKRLCGDNYQLNDFVKQIPRNFKRFCERYGFKVKTIKDIILQQLIGKIGMREAAKL